MNRLIAIYSPAPQSGKTSVSMALTSKGFTRLSFAAPLKRMCIEFLQSLGYSKNEAIRYVFAEKHEYIPEVKKTVRYLLQTLGTEWGRNCVDQDVWLTAFRKTAELYDSVVVDDMRFPNEAELVKKMGGELWKIVRPGLVNEFRHPSEGGLDDYKFDQVIRNDDTLENLRKKVYELI